jgi:hypothetical protein
MIYLPTPPTTPDPGLNDWLYKLFRFAESLRPRQSLGTKTMHTVHGVTRQAVPGSSGGRPTDRYKGEWSPSATYRQFDWVVVTNDFESGAFIANQDVPANQHPRSGVYWTQFSRLSDNWQ